MEVETQPSAQSSFQNLNVDNSCQKTRKIRCYIFEVVQFYCISLLCAKYFLEACIFEGSYIYLYFVKQIS